MIDAKESILLQKMAKHVRANRSTGQWGWRLGAAIYDKACKQLDSVPDTAVEKLAVLVLDHKSIKDLPPDLTKEELTEMLRNQVVGEACVPEEIMRATAEILEFPTDPKRPEFGALLGLFQVADSLVDKEAAMNALEEE